MGGVVPGALDTAIWDNTVVADSTDVSLGVNTSWNQIKIIDPGSTVHINDDTLTLGVGGIDMSNSTNWLAFGSKVNIGANQEWNIANQKRVTCNSPLIGSYSITKTGEGVLRLGSDNNTFSGELTISEGILQIGKNDAGGSLPVDVTNNGTVLFTKTVDYEYSGIISGSGTVEQADTGKITLSGNNTYSGLTTITTGALVVRHENALGDTSSGTIVDSGAALIIDDTINVLEPLTLNGAGISNEGALINSKGETQYNGAINLSTASTINNMSSDFLYLDGIISGGGDLTIKGNRAVVIREDNTYSGTTSILSERLWLMEDNALGSTSGSTIVFPDASVYIISGITVPELFNISGAGYDSTGAIKSYRDTNEISGNVTLDGASIISVNEGVLTISGILSGGYDLEKIDLGRLVLPGNNLNKGSIKLTEGSLILNGTNDSVSSVTVSNGSLLGGKGSVGGSVTINDSSVLDPGDTGTAKFSVGALIMSSGSTLSVELGTLSDTVEVLGDLTLDGILEIDTVAGFDTGTYTIMTYDGTLTNNALSIISDVDTVYDFTIVTDNNRIDLTIKPIHALDTPSVIHPIDNVIVNEDASDTIIAILTSVFNDPQDSMNLTFNAYSLDKEKVLVSIISDSILTFDFIENAHGTTNVVITATDNDNLSAYDTVQVIINSVNDAPVLHSITPWVMEDGLPVSLTLSQVYATDVDGDELNMIVDTGSNYTVDSLTITPTIGFTGFLNIPMTVTDGIDTSNKLSVIVEVKSAGENRPPMLTAANISPIGKNGALRVTTNMLEAYDPDGDSLTIFIFEGDNYVAQGTMIIPDKGFTGYLQVPIKVTDGISLSEGVVARVSVFEKVIDFYKGQVINSDTYEAKQLALTPYLRMQKPWSFDQL